MTGARSGPRASVPARSPARLLIRGKEISDAEAPTVQDAVWQITDGDGLTEDMRSQLVAF